VELGFTPDDCKGTFEPRCLVEVEDRLADGLSLSLVGRSRLGFTPDDCKGTFEPRCLVEVEDRLADGLSLSLVGRSDDLGLVLPPMIVKGHLSLAVWLRWRIGSPTGCRCHWLDDLTISAWFYPR